MCAALEESCPVSPVWSCPSGHSSLDTGSGRTWYAATPVETSPTLRWASKNADVLRAELERMHAAGAGAGGARPEEPHSSRHAATAHACTHATQQKQTHTHAIPAHRNLPSSPASAVHVPPLAAASDDAVSQFELIFLDDEDDGEDGAGTVVEHPAQRQRTVHKAASASAAASRAPVRAHTDPVSHHVPAAAPAHPPHPQPSASPAMSPNAPHQPLAYTDLASFRPYDRTHVADADRLSMLSYPGSFVYLPSPSHPSHPSSSPRDGSSASGASSTPSSTTVDTLYVPEDSGDAAYVLEWKSASDAAYKEVMGMLGREEWSVQRGWAYKKTNVDSLQWSISYVPGMFDNVIADTSGALPRLELTLFYNSLPLFLTATQTLPARLPNLRIPTFASHILTTLPFATEWAQIISPGPARLWCNTYRLALIVRAQGEDLSPRCRGILETWAGEVWRTERMVRTCAVVGTLSKAAKEGTKGVAVISRLMDEACPTKRAEKAERELSNGV
ncbi:hypothetical protein M427DRAFT_37505 [Gonapodya prolifera JEL478]|uniref:Uncharacterized protein n=1 Tax=Gonapodya prolifera (strain JEL478) TaxID=1344416 RepID=A0A139A0Q4_GONPJ|nr:hypothetical protein M427DRAFT_37505 [Gonapodya prolifera JEL478]|eukprot:KXS10341.1 hypothetical protein M427DRAFT_37505 [Gonapodya prolifera JEL478]